MEAVSSSFLAPFFQLNRSCSPPKPTPVNITFPTIANIRVELGSFDKTQPRTPSPTTTTTTTASTVEPPPPLERPYKTVSPAKVRSPQSFPVMLCNTLDDLIDNFVARHPLRSSVNPRVVLSGNHARVSELPPTKCIVEGQLPRCLNGAYIRNGPNPQFVLKAGYHLFDGDGMLHALHISGGQATFCSRFVRTYRFTKEEEAGQPIYPNFFALEGVTGFARAKVDPITGEVFSFRYGPIPPFLNYFRVGADGEKQPDVPIFSYRQPSFMHDFAITERYAIFPDLQIVMKPLAVFTETGPPMTYEAGKVARLGIVPRYATDESGMKWIEVPGFNFVHPVNAWDEKGGEEVVLVAANAVPAEYMLERMDLRHCCVEMVRINVREGKVVSRKPLSTRNLEWGAINPKFVGRKNRYAFMAMGEPMPKISAFMKMDLDRAGAGDCVVAARSFGEGCFAGEPFFVAKEESGDEDDGYLLTYVHDEGSGESRFVVIDGKSPTLDIVASVRLPWYLCQSKGFAEAEELEIMRIRNRYRISTCIS